MTFPDGQTKEGYFENNVYKIKVQVGDEDAQLHPEATTNASSG